MTFEKEKTHITSQNAFYHNLSKTATGIRHFSATARKEPGKSLIRDKDNERLIEPSERRAIEKWLFNKREYCKLYLDMADDLYGETFEYIDGIRKRNYLNCRFINPEKLEYNGGIVGYKATLEADSNIKEILYPIKNGEFDSMKEALQTSRNLTMSSALASEGEEVLIDGSGYTGKKRLSNGTFDPRQVKLTGRTLVFTDDAWESCKVALGELIFGDGTSAYGVNAETIIGDILIGHNIRILDEDGNDLFAAVDGKIKTFVDEIVYGDDEQLQPDGSASIIRQISSIEQKADGVGIIVGQISTQNPDGTYSVDVDQVTTRTGYTFNTDGLLIFRSGEEIKNLLDNTGMYITRSGTEILTANNEGVSAINLTARQYLIVGANSRLEDYSNGTDSNRTACFYIGS